MWFLQPYCDSSDIVRILCKAIFFLRFVISDESVIKAKDDFMISDKIIETCISPIHNFLTYIIYLDPHSNLGSGCCALSLYTYEEMSVRITRLVKSRTLI